jgi:hypothetical protein
VRVVDLKRETWTLQNLDRLKFWERRYSHASVNTQREMDNELFFLVGMLMFHISTIAFVVWLSMIRSERLLDWTTWQIWPGAYLLTVLLSRLLMTPAVRRDCMMWQLHPGLRRGLRLLFWRWP